MFLTVGICTWNRAKLLDLALTSFHKLIIPEHIEWELIIVNNNCSDETDEIIANHKSNLPIRRLFEPHPGKSHALNHAIREARGEYIVWTDDDALVDPNWLKAYADAFTRSPDASFFGGPVKAWFRTEPPNWLNEQTLPLVSTAYAIRDLGDESFKFTYSNLPYGVNMAVRYKEQCKYLYDTNIGPRPNSSLRGEETVLLNKMLEDGETGRWVPGAIVNHYIPQERHTIRYLRSYYRGHGEFQWIEIGNGDTPNRFGTIIDMLKKALKTEFRYRYCRLFKDPKAWVKALIGSSMASGRLLGRTRSYIGDR
jgi:glycosyltransferase involved in cell wall biosynthesis